MFQKKCQFSTLIIIINVSSAQNQRIRMISEEDTEDWRKFSFTITGIHYILKLLKFKTIILSLIIFKQY